MKIPLLRSFAPCLWLLAIAGLAEADDSQPLPTRFPAGPLAYAELTGLDEVVVRFEKSAFWKSVRETPQAQAFYQSTNYRKVEAFRDLSSRMIEQDILEFVRKMIGHRVGVAVYPVANRPQPDVLVVVQPANGDSIATLRGILDPLLLLSDQQSRTRETDQGWTIVTTPPGPRVILGQDWLAIATSSAIVDQFEALATGQSDASLGNQSGAFAATWKTGGSDNLLQAWVDLEMVRSLSSNPPSQKLDNPLGSLLFGHALLLGSESPDALVTLRAEDDRLQFRLHMLQGALAHQAPWTSYFSSPDGIGAQPVPRVPGLLAGLTLHRDFDGWYQSREELIQEEMLPGFDKFEAGLANLLPGRDFGEDVLPLLGDSFTLLAAPQQYDHLQGEPGIKFPGIAVLFAMDEPEKASALFDLFFQTLSAILNIQAGQQGRQPWIISSETYRDVQINYGRYLSPPEGTSLPFVFNFMPASARIGRHYIMSSSRGLCRQMIDHLSEPDPKNRERGNRNFEFSLEVEPVIGEFRRNESFFVAQSVKQGKSLDAAKEEFDSLLDVVDHLSSFGVWTRVGQSHFDLVIEGVWK